MANAWKNPSLIAKLFAVNLYNELVLGRLVDARFKNEFVPETGGTVTIRKVTRFAGSTGATISSYEDVVEGSTSITVDKRFKVPFVVSDEEYALNIKDITKRIIKPAVKTIAEYIETTLAGLYTQIPMHYGSPGTGPSTFAHLSTLAQAMDEHGVPKTDRVFVCEPKAAWALAGDMKSLYISDKAKTALEFGRVGKYAGFDVYDSNAITAHTVGALGGSPLVDGASQNVAYTTCKDTWTQTLNIDSVGAGGAVTNFFKKGDVFTIAGVYDVNPGNKETLSNLKEFTVTADVNAGSVADYNIAAVISPPIITSGAFQTCSAAPADDAAITVKTGTAATAYRQNIAFHKDAIALVTVPLQKPDNVWVAREQIGAYNIRIVKQYDITHSRDLYRADIFFGCKVVNPEMAVRRTS